MLICEGLKPLPVRKFWFLVYLGHQWKKNVNFVLNCKIVHFGLPSRMAADMANHVAHWPMSMLDKGPKANNSCIKAKMNIILLL